MAYMLLRGGGSWRQVWKLAIPAMLGVAAGLVVVQSGWFHEYVRARIISEVEKATGRRVEIGSFSFRGAVDFRAQKFANGRPLKNQ